MIHIMSSTISFIGSCDEEASTLKIRVNSQYIIFLLNIFFVILNLYLLNFGLIILKSRIFVGY